MTLAEAEADISDMLKDASASYAGDPEAMRLRTMHLAYESVKQSGGTLVHPQRLQRGLCARRRGEGLATDDASVLQWASPRELGPEGPGRPKTSR